MVEAMIDTRGRIELRAATGPMGALRPAELARRLGVIPASVSHWRTGRFRPSVEYRAALKSLLGIEPEAWLTDAERAEVRELSEKLDQFRAQSGDGR